MVNMASKLGKYPIPRIEDLFARLADVPANSPIRDSP